MNAHGRPREENSYLLARSAVVECHDCSCHISPPCSACVECETCNPCWECDEVHDGPRNEDCTNGAALGESDR